MSYYLAVDLGAESGRVMLGALSQGRLSLEELHRFPNTPVRLPNGLYWDSFRLFHEIVHGLAVAGRERNLKVSGIGIDTWGVDFGLLASDGALVDNPRHYRDSRTDGVPDKYFEVIPRSEVFERTGIQFMQLNSLYQLYAMRLAGAPALRVAGKLLFMPDLFSYWLTGAQRSERTIASTSQFYDPRAKAFAPDLLERAGIPSHILPDIVEPGARLGELLPHVASETNLGAASVFATAAHDTASAVAAVPAREDGWCYISSGTWSLMGVEIDEPIINQRALELNYTNEVGAGGRIRFLKNIAGMWLLQECRRAWAAQGLDFTYEQLMQLAAEAGPARAHIDPDAFLHPGEMPSKIQAYCRSRGCAPPETPGEICRMVLESLARRYHEVLENLEALTARRIQVIHIVGGGSRNRLLNQLAADATGRMVIAGPAEATAAGNILVQAIGAGELGGLDEAREVVRSSFEPEVFKPREATRPAGR
jgi:rhamnulokinase